MASLDLTRRPLQNWLAPCDDRLFEMIETILPPEWLAAKEIERRTEQLTIDGLASQSCLARDKTGIGSLG